jgi:glycosyltransferase involved in cell wall biosynthesis
MASQIVSVIVPTKNSSSTLEDCLSSINEQTHAPTELIVVDNFSTDETPAIAKRFTKHFYSQGPERSAQRNFGVNKASGAYVAIIDSDMNLSDSVIAECVKLLENNKDAVGVVIPEESFGEGFWAQCKKLERSFYLGVPYIEAARFFKKDVYEKVGGYDIEMTSGEDWDLSQRIEQHGKLLRCSSFIYHNEGRISLLRTVQKKYYYAKHFSAYQHKGTSPKIAQQTNVLARYRLFFSNPRKLFANPAVGVGMLFMKTCEFAFGGLGLLVSKLKNPAAKP